MKASELLDLSDEQLISEFERLIAEETKEINFRRGGVTKKTSSSLSNAKSELLKRLHRA